MRFLLDQAKLENEALTARVAEESRARQDVELRNSELRELLERERCNYEEVERLKNLLFSFEAKLEEQEGRILPLNRENTELRERLIRLEDELAQERRSRASREDDLLR